MCVVISSRPMLYQTQKRVSYPPLCVLIILSLCRKASAFGVAPNRSVTDIMPRLVTPAEVTMCVNGFTHNA